MPPIDDASRFVAEAEERLAAANVEQQINLGVALAKDAAKFDAAGGLPFDVRRKLDLIKLSLTSPGPADPAKTAEIARIAQPTEASTATHRPTSSASIL